MSGNNNAEMIPVKKLHLPDAPAQAPQIDWGEEFNEAPLDHQNRYLKKLASALNHATTLIQNERNELLVTVGTYKEQMENQERLASERRDTLQNFITTSNAEKQQLIAENARLQRQLDALNIE